ncbi:MAG: hypothetical protein Q7T73_14890 [Beijerinckiaceae bacterium]|nr:hypothetical protein [Beijerinckiaceae bacterium]
MRKSFNKSVEARLARIRKLRLLQMKRTMACSLTDYLGLYPTPATVAAVIERVARKARKTPAELTEHGVEVRILFERFLTDGKWFSADIAMVVVSQKVDAA